MDNKAPDAFRTISEVADELDLPQHVLRFWESRFHEIKPMKRGGGRRYYRPDDIDLLRGVQRILREQGVKFDQAVWQDGAPQPPHGVIEEYEFADEAVTTEDDDVDTEEECGLRGRLSSLIGRDLGDRQDDAASRVEPPLTSAPVPRIDPTDRAIHGLTAADPSTSAEPMPATSRQPASGTTGCGLGREDLRKLHAALHELAECRKLVDAAVTRPH